MVAKHARISRADFPAILRSSRRYHSDTVSAVVAPGAKTQVSVVVSKKVAKKSVDRNRLRRRVYGATERFLREATIPAAMIFFLKPGALQVSRQALATEVTELLAQIVKSR